MNNCLIMGFGRSGTSLMGGILHQNGYYMGDDLYPPRNSNPKGFFENAFINGINERIMMQYDYAMVSESFPLFEKLHSPYHPGYGHRWLSFIQPTAKIENSTPEILNDIQTAISHRNFAYKDPRFNFTLGVWKPFLDNDVIFICMFRNPAITIQSVIDECNNAEYLADFYVDTNIVEELWINSYKRLLQSVETIGADRFLFVHYQQLITGEALPRLSRALDLGLKDSFIDPGLDRTRNHPTVNQRTVNLYKELCHMAQYKLPSE